MTTNVLPIVKITTPNGQSCDVNAYHITMIDHRRSPNKGYSYPTVCLSNGMQIAVTEEEAQRISEAVSKVAEQSRYDRSVNTCKFQKPL